MRRIEIAKILRNESDFLAKYFLSKLSEISNFNNQVVFRKDKEVSRDPNKVCMLSWKMKKGKDVGFYNHPNHLSSYPFLEAFCRGPTFSFLLFFPFHFLIIVSNSLTPFLNLPMHKIKNKPNSVEARNS